MALLPPRVIGPLSQCSTSVIVEGMLTGADVEVFANGVSVASGTASGPRQTFALTTGLSAGDLVTARQRVGMETSPPSPEPIQVQAKPPTIGPVAYRSHLHVCGRCIWLEGLVPGAKVEVHGNGGLRGTGESYDGNARVGLNGPIEPGEILRAKQEACGEAGPESAGPEPDFPNGGKERPQRLPKPTVESPLRACQRGVVVSDVFEGARVTLLRSAGPNLQACFDATALRFGVNPGLVEGENVSARQEFPDCEIVGDDADPVIVGPAEPVPAPSVQAPLCVGAFSVRLHGLLFGSKVRILLDGMEIGIGESPEEGSYDFLIPPLPAPVHGGSFVTAQQELCGIWSAESPPVPVNPAPAELPRPKITEPLVECAAAVHVSNLHPGALVEVISSMLGAPIGIAWTYSDEALVPVAPLLIADDKIFARQKGCGLVSAESEPVIVQRFGDLPVPEVVKPLYDCDTPVAVTNTVPGARVEVYINGIYRGSALAGTDPTPVPIIGKLSAGDQVQARQRLCNRSTRLSEPVVVEHFDGRWFAVGNSGKAEILAVHAALLPTNRILYFGGDQHTSSLNENGDVDHTRLLDCDTHAVTGVTGLPPSADLFCAGHAQLPDGRILVAGGTHAWPSGVDEDPHGHGGAGHFVGSGESWIFDPADHQWHPTSKMVTQRPGDPSRDASLDIERSGGKWYPTLLSLPDGRVLAVSGHPREFDSRHNNDTLERFGAGTAAWDYVGSIDCNRIPRTVGRTLEYPRLFVLPNGRMLSVSQLADGSLSTWNIGDDPNDWASITTPRPGYGGNPLNHTAVLMPLRPQDEYRPRVLMCGESTAWVLDPQGSPTWTPTARKLIGHPAPSDMNPRRANLDAVILPSGEIFVEGGAKDTRDDDTGVKKAEMFDPEDMTDSPVGSWCVLPEAQEVRNYHSVALLMPNGAVWVAGSNFNSATGLGNRNLWIEIFEPWYFCHQRPTIAEAPDNLRLGERFVIRSNDAARIGRVVLIRCGTCTHNFNPDQRLVELSFEYEAPDRLIAWPPNSASVAIPGCYLLFIVTNARVPSTGRFVRVTAADSGLRVEWPPDWLREVEFRVTIDPRLLDLLRRLIRSPEDDGRNN